MSIVRYFHSAAMAGEESRQVLYSGGPWVPGILIMEAKKELLKTVEKYMH